MEEEFAHPRYYRQEIKPVPRSLYAVLSAIVALLVITPTAQAASCDESGLSQAFLPWHDSAFYAPTPNGDFESGSTGWTLSGGAVVVAGGNPHFPGSGASALSLPSGSSAVSPPVCVASGSPTARMFAQTLSGGSGASLQVEVLYESGRGQDATGNAGHLPSLSEFGPTRKFSLAQGRLGTKPGSEETASIRFRFTPREGAHWLIDDLLVDPRRRH
jgi:hypothetical protein